MKRSTPATVLCVGFTVAAGTWLYDRHNFSVLWPAQVQREVLGNEIVTSDALISKERHFSQYAEGFARWRYRVVDSNPLVQRLCGNREVAHCSFDRSREVQEGVSVSVSLSNGIVTLEEWWD